ncbi:hypothetical protein, partial [Pseudovibrio sp. Ad5]|uniref:hypothetical protein n=1 Tax=Pseudovibrio sp. Ad5 TaxID=989436 RepID=UPI0019D36591
MATFLVECRCQIDGGFNWWMDRLLPRGAGSIVILLLFNRSSPMTTELLSVGIDIGKDTLH